MTTLNTRNSTHKTFFIREENTNRITEVSMPLKEFRTVYGLTESSSKKPKGKLSDGRPWARSLADLPSLKQNLCASRVGYYKPRTKFPRSHLNRSFIEDIMLDIIDSAIMDNLNAQGITEVFYDGYGFYSEGEPDGDAYYASNNKEYQAYKHNYTDVLFPTIVWPQIVDYLNDTHQSGLTADVWENLCRWAFTQAKVPFSASNSPRFIARVRSRKYFDSRIKSIPKNNWNKDIDDVCLLEAIERVALAHPEVSEGIRDPQSEPESHLQVLLNTLRIQMVSSAIGEAGYELVGCMRTISKPKGGITYSSAYSNLLVNKANAMTKKIEHLEEYAMLAGIEIDQIS